MLLSVSKAAPMPLNRKTGLRIKTEPTNPRNIETSCSVFSRSFSMILANTTKIIDDKYLSDSASLKQIIRMLK